MSCNGCRILRKGCNDNCILRQSLRGTQNPQAQANATVFVAKFFGRAGLMSFLSGVPEPQRPALFQSLLFEACGRTVNPVNGVVGLLWSGKWHVCQTAVDTVLHGGALQPLPEFSVEVHGTNNNNNMQYMKMMQKRKEFDDMADTELDLGLPVGGGVGVGNGRKKKMRASTPSEHSETTTSTLETAFFSHHHQDKKLLTLFL